MIWLAGFLLLVLGGLAECAFWLWMHDQGHLEWSVKRALLLFGSFIALIAGIILLGS